MKIIIIGIQGAGKSTQGNLLSKELSIPYLSTGHIFREIAKEHTALGRYIKETMNAGYLIPDDKTLEIVSEYLSRLKYQIRRRYGDYHIGMSNEKMIRLLVSENVLSYSINSQSQLLHIIDIKDF